LWAQTNSTDWTRGGVEVERDLAGEALDEELRRLVVQAAAAHVDRLDLGRRGGADRPVVAVADHLVVLDDLADRRQREMVRDDGLAAFSADVEAEPVLDDREMQRIGPALVARNREGVGFEDVVDRDRALVLLVRAAAADRGLVEGQRDEAAPVWSVIRHRSPIGRFRRLYRERGGVRQIATGAAGGRYGGYG
jgi:hypothetical protein